MRLATILLDGAVTAALVDESERARVLPYGDAAQAIAAEIATPGALDAAGAEPVEPERYRLLAPIPRPGKIFGSGINYVGHKLENPNAVMPVEPGFFSKFPSSVVGPDAEVILPAAVSEVDYEVEIAIVIGRPGRDIPAADAYDHVFGYTLINDVSDREVQFRPNQMDLGKGFDTFCPMGPWIVDRDSIGDIDAVRLTSRINGELRQDASTSEWIFRVPELIAHASRHLTLETGDIITTGTPAGCGTFRNPPLWLREGDDMEIAAEGIGVLRNPVRLAPRD